MSTAEPMQDPQDKAFGAAASRDQEIVDELEREGVPEAELPDQPAQHPRAGGKAEPVGSDGASDRTGESDAERNQKEEPPA